MSLLMHCTGSRLLGAASEPSSFRHTRGSRMTCMRRNGKTREETEGSPAKPNAKAHTAKNKNEPREPREMHTRSCGASTSGCPRRRQRRTRPCLRQTPCPLVARRVMPSNCYICTRLDGSSCVAAWRLFPTSARAYVASAIRFPSPRCFIDDKYLLKANFSSYEITHETLQISEVATANFFTSSPGVAAYQLILVVLAAPHFSAMLLRPYNPLTFSSKSYTSPSSASRISRCGTTLTSCSSHGWSSSSKQQFRTHPAMPHRRTWGGKGRMPSPQSTPERKRREG